MKTKVAGKICLQDVINYVCIKRIGTRAFIGWDDDLIKTFLRKIFVNQEGPVKFCLRIRKNEIVGFLMIKVFKDEHRVHVSQVIADDTEAFYFLMRVLNIEYGIRGYVMSAERRMHPKIYGNYDRMLRLIKQFSNKEQ